MLNRRSLRRNRGIWWVFAVPLIVVVLVVIIVQNEPEHDGISRAAACKAVALSLAEADEIRDEAAEEKSYFSAADQRQWYVTYMDYLYRIGIISEDMMPPAMQIAEGMLTYEEVQYLAEQVLESNHVDAMTSENVRFSVKQKIADLIHVNDRNRTRPFPEEQWWYVYHELCLLAPEDQQVVEETLQIYGTPDNMEDAPAWTAYTDQGFYGFDGLSLGRYIDREIRVLARGDELIRVIEKTSDQVTYRNVWITEAENQLLKGYFEDIIRYFSVEKKLSNPQDMVNQLADIQLKNGKVERVVLKRDKITAKVLAVKDDSIELEGYGPVPLDDHFSVYKTYGTFERQSLEQILVGYDTQEFVVADGKICAAMIVRTFNAQSIRVLLMDTGFHSLFHQNISLEFLSDGVWIQDEKEHVFHDGDTIELTAGDERLKGGRMIFKPSDESVGIRVTSLERGQGVPAYQGRLEISDEEDGLVLVNELYLEDYLKSVLPSEMPLSYDMEALKAQAVCARTYAYRQIQGNTYMRYGAHVDDSTNFQVYNNSQSGSAGDAAVNETYGQFLMYGDDMAETYYFSTSCGHTTDAAIWGADLDRVPYLKAKAVRESGGSLDLTTNNAFGEFIKGNGNGFEANYAMYRWTTQITGKQLEQKISDLGTITQVAVSKRGAGGIGSVLVVEGTEGRREYQGESRIRSILGTTELVIRRNDGSTVTGWPALPSAFIYIERSQPNENGVTTFTIYGGGYGHGIGMSQNGAQAMAKRGWSYEDILEFFYEGTKLKTVY